MRFLIDYVFAILVLYELSDSMAASCFLKFLSLENISEIAKWRDFLSISRFVKFFSSSSPVGSESDSACSRERGYNHRELIFIIVARHSSSHFCQFTELRQDRITRELLNDKRA